MTSPDLVVTRQSIGSDAARRLVDLAIGHARLKGWSVAACVVDIAGHVLALARMDDAPPTVAEFATDKAFTAAMTNKTTRAFFERMSASPELSMGLASRPRLLCWEGGLPIVLNGRVIGGIGVSGALGPEDAECAEVALTASGLDAGGA